MRETKGIETESLLESRNLFTEGHILCSARERASNTDFFLVAKGCVCVYMCVSVCVLAKSECMRKRG